MEYVYADVLILSPLYRRKQIMKNVIETLKELDKYYADNEAA